MPVCFGLTGGRELGCVGVAEGVAVPIRSASIIPCCTFVLFHPHLYRIHWRLRRTLEHCCCLHSERSLYFSLWDFPAFVEHSLSSLFLLHCLDYQAFLVGISCTGCFITFARLFYFVRRSLVIALRISAALVTLSPLHFIQLHTVGFSCIGYIVTSALYWFLHYWASYFSLFLGLSITELHCNFLLPCNHIHSPWVCIVFISTCIISLAHLVPSTFHLHPQPSCTVFIYSWSTHHVLGYFVALRPHLSAFTLFTQAWDFFLTD